MRKFILIIVMFFFLLNGNIFSQVMGGGDIVLDYDSNVFRDHYSDWDWIMRSYWFLGFGNEKISFLYSGNYNIFGYFNQLNYHFHSLELNGNKKLGKRNSFNFNIKSELRLNKSEYEYYNEAYNTGEFELKIYPQKDILIKAVGGITYLKYLTHAEYEHLRGNFKLQLNKFFPVGLTFRLEGEYSRANFFRGGTLEVPEFSNQVVGKIRLAKSLTELSGIFMEFEYWKNEVGDESYLAPDPLFEEFWDYYSYSMQLVRSQYKAYLPYGFSLQIEARYFSRNFSELEARDLEGNSKQVPRKDKELLTGVVLKKLLNKPDSASFRLVLSALYNIMYSNDDLYDFSRYVLSCGLNVRF